MGGVWIKMKIPKTFVPDNPAKKLESLLEKEPEKRASLESSKPVIGQDVYVGTKLFLGHGRDDFQGGLCKIIKIEEGLSGGEKTYFVGVEERHGCLYNWEHLQENQAKWKKEYGNKRGYPDPDYRPEFNDW